MVICPKVTLVGAKPLRQPQSPDPSSWILMELTQQEGTTSPMQEPGSAIKCTLGSICDGPMNHVLQARCSPRSLWLELRCAQETLHGPVCWLLPEHKVMNEHLHQSE
ncbi:hypothetical protein CEXT_323771 [Caerostris extrusa]|uniref:Uncharacterized protein n=1 Tax=Caerostris extrusa TaxID=172846 RepID=A0AAV4SVK6_CAEEX|nr:hypothetical protein CEXT_323771 [Caerostris extrusa]